MTLNDFRIIWPIGVLLLCSLQSQQSYSQSRQDIAENMDSLHVIAQQDPNSSLKLIEPLLDRSREKAWIKEEAGLLARKAIAFDLLGKYDSAFGANLEALEIFESLNDQNGLSLVHNNLGILAFSRYEYHDALDHFSSSLEADLALGDSLSLAGTLINIGIIASYLEMPDSSLTCYQKASEIYEAKNDPIGQAMANSNRAKILFSEGRLNESEKIYNSVIQSLNDNGGGYEPMVTAHNSLAVVYREMGKLNLAEQESRKSIDIAQKNNLPERLLYCYQTLSEILERRGQHEEALVYYKLFTSTRDSIYSREKELMVADIESQYELEKKEKALALSELEVEKAELEQEKKTAQRNMWIGVSTLFVLLSFFILQRYRSRTRESHLLEEKNRLNAQMLEQQSTLLSETHHRIKNNLQVISSMLSMQANHVQDPQAQSALHSCVERVSNIALLHEQLQIAEEKQGVSLKEYLQELVASLSSASGRENCQIRLDLEDHTFPIEIALPIGLIVNELVTNSLKHASPENDHLIIDISLRQSGDHFNLCIKDNGLIAHEELSRKLDRSFGWQIVKSFSRQIKASYEIKEAPGMEISILFSLKKSDL